MGVFDLITRAFDIWWNITWFFISPFYMVFWHFFGPIYNVLGIGKDYVLTQVGNVASVAINVLWRACWFLFKWFCFAIIAMIINAVLVLFLRALVMPIGYVSAPIYLDFRYALQSFFLICQQRCAIWCCTLHPTSFKTKRHLSTKISLCSTTLSHFCIHASSRNT